MDWGNFEFGELCRYRKGPWLALSGHLEGADPDRRHDRQSHDRGTRKMPRLGDGRLPFQAGPQGRAPVGAHEVAGPCKAIISRSSERGTQRFYILFGYDSVTNSPVERHFGDDCQRSRAEMRRDELQACPSRHLWPGDLV